MKVRVLGLLFVVGLSACTSLEPIPESLSHDAYACMQRYSPDDDPMQQASGEAVPESLFFRINHSKEALEWRLALTDSATESLDIQYFLWRADDTGSLLIKHVLAAADRGVLVRMLIDDLDSTNWEPLARAFNQHENIQIRVFNPFLKGRGGWGQRGRELLIDLDRMNHRMHNKLFKVDRTAAIVGGRNIGDEYYGSLNFDPRSLHWNTELGWLIDSTGLAEQIYQDFTDDLNPKNSWRVEMRTETESSQGVAYDVKKLYWVSDSEELSSEPSRGVGQKFSNWFYSLFPLDEQL